MLLFFHCSTLLGNNPGAVFVEAESFSDPGGWVIDQQSMDVMGSPYLMAHGMGLPVADASTEIKFPQQGRYRMFVRTRNWTARWSEQAAGQFQVLLNGKPLEQTFGTTNNDWSWVDGGFIEIENPSVTITLHDLTGFNGRCDALYFTPDHTETPPNDLESLDAFRTNLLGLSSEPEIREFDFVVIGGGMAGTCAAIAAARLGVQVALVQNRPVLGGNNSSEVRVHLGARINLEPYPALGNLVNEIGPDQGGNAQPKDYYEDDKKLQAVLNEPNLSLFLNTHANQVEVKDDKIVQVTAENIRTGERIAFRAPLFADCTGDGTIGFLAGAEYMTGRESRDTFNEPTAPEEADNLTMGISVQWFSETGEQPSEFPDIKWGLPWSEEKSFAITRGDWDWETGMGKDMIRETEFIRDYGLLVVYSNWSFLKNHYIDKERFAREKLRWVAYVGGKRESRRLVGDYILNENDITERKLMPDGTAPTSWTIDLHYPDPENEEKFEGEAFRSIAEHIKIYPYPIPFRCLYSKNIDNLLMAGRDISVSHVALGTTRLMRTCGMMGEVLGMAASVSKAKDATPRQIYQQHFAALEQLMLTGVGNPDIPNKQDYNLGSTLMEQ
ncbi:MAG: pyridine nucleotide-disulfide oxidoreductase [Cyclobacteriaceae bacterium]|nr:MAG: pyridine nucleotide-disulfide oxidoreductase [Cyclobacteriaceae bacterium]